MRRGYLDWLHANRPLASPTGYWLQFLRTLEFALVWDKRIEVAHHARTELERLLSSIDHHPEARDWAGRLLKLCQWLDPAFIPDPVLASAATNYRPQMPFEVAEFIGRMLMTSPQLEAEAALTFVLQQPHTRLDPHAAQNFGFVHHMWSEAYAHRFNGGVEVETTKRLAFRYECGLGIFEFPSDLLDVRNVEVPSGLRDLFKECLDAIEPLREMPVALQTRTQLTNLPKLGRQPEFSVRADGAARLHRRLAGSSFATLKVADLVTDLFEGVELHSKRMINSRLERRITTVLDEQGIGFEPDARYEMPSQLRPTASVVIFPEQPLPFEDPTDAFLLAQAAMILSGIGCRLHPSLQPLRATEIETRLPYRHRFSDREMVRLEATFLAMERAERGRALLSKWPRMMKRQKRTADIDEGFGIAFEGQEKNPDLVKLANAISVALHDDRARAPRLLAAVAARHSGIEVAAEHIEASAGSRASTTSQVPVQVRCRSADVTATSPIEGLSAADAAILLALQKRPRPRNELAELARARHTTLIGALNRINEWGLLRYNLSATRGGETVRINPAVADALGALVAQP
jgi:hypothetical protein